MLITDSPSSHTSYSRPITPQNSQITQLPISTSQPELPYAIAQKAERILGLRPGTLPHARAALESAKEEVRRLDQPAPPMMPIQFEDGGGVKGKFDRAVKAMSVALPHTAKVPNVVVGIGGWEEEARRDKVRRANDGVLYWQKEVARLAAEDEATLKTNRTRRNR